MKRKVTTVVGKAITIALGVISCENVENSAHLWYEPALVYKLRISDQQEVRNPSLVVIIVSLTWIEQNIIVIRTFCGILDKKYG